jgi:hypothetical protein
VSKECGARLATKKNRAHRRSRKQAGSHPRVTAMITRGTLLLLPTVVAALSVSLPDAAHARSQTGFDPRVVTFGAEREQIKSTPIEQRPYRPLHVYGNSVRRRQTRR